MNNNKVISIIATTSIAILVFIPNTNAHEKIQSQTPTLKQSTTHKPDRNTHREQFSNTYKQVKNQIEKNITNLSNGVQIDLTSQNEEAIAILKQKDLRKSHRKETTRTKEHIENGVRLIITSSNPKLVEKIQSRAKKKNQNKKN